MFNEGRLERLENTVNQIKELLMSSTALPGLAALNAAVTALTAGVAAAITELEALVTQLGASEDPQVAAAAALIQTQITNLATAVSAAAAPPATPASEVKKA